MARVRAHPERDYKIYNYWNEQDKRKIEGRSSNSSLCRKAISMKYSEYVSVPLVI
jgi:hypothetical protein